MGGIIVNKGCKIDLPYRVLKVDCPECNGNGLAYFDEDRCEVFCGDCGLVLFFNPPFDPGFPALGGAAFNVGALEGSVLIGGGEPYCPSYPQREYLPHTTKLKGKKEEWRKKQYHRYVGVVHTNLWLTPGEKARAHYIIDQVKNFHKLHGRNDYEFLVTAICIYAMYENKGGLTVSFEEDFLHSLRMKKSDFFRIRNKLDACLGKTD